MPICRASSRIRPITAARLASLPGNLAWAHPTVVKVSAAANPPSNRARRDMGEFVIVLPFMPWALHISGNATGTEIIQIAACQLQAALEYRNESGFRGSLGVSLLT